MNKDFTIRLENNPHARQEDIQPTMAMHPHKFALWLFIISIVMIFAALTSAYIVRRAEGNWLNFELPPVLWMSSAVLVLSSATVHWSFLMAKVDNLNMVKVGLWVTLALGLVFTYLQVYEAWPWLVANNVYFGGDTANPSGSFVYVISGVHVFHLFTGLGFIIVMLVQASRLRVHKKNLVGIEMCATYWHFLDILWIYLFIFLLMNR